MERTPELLALDVPYRTGPIALTDLHAGGIFFCVVYRECLQFDADGRVRRWSEVIDDSRAFDDEADRLREGEAAGTYRINGRGYLECKFRDLKLTGLTCERAPGLLAFCARRPVPEPAEMDATFSLVYARSEPTPG